MEINANINTFHKGLDLDSDISILEKNTLRYAENIKLVANESGTQAAISNANYIQLSGIKLPNTEEYNITGVTSVKYHWNGEESSPVESIAVFTKSKNDETDYLFVINPNTEEVKEIFHGDFKFGTNLSLLSNYESPKISNIFIADGINELRCVNLAKDYSNITDTTIFDITPASYLEAPMFSNLDTGNLKSGKYQYTYSLFSKNGSVSAISELSEMIPISATMGASHSDKIRGSKFDENTGKSIKFNAKFINRNFDHIRIYRLFYNNSGQLPQINIIAEQEIKQNNAIQSFEYTDYTNSVISVVTADELQALYSKNIFSAKTIDSKDNILFAANIEEHTWDVDFDARAYRADKNGNVVLNSSLGKPLEFNINYIPDIAEDHDCINPSNIELFGENSFKYVYGKNNKLGGAGINVSYEFVFTPVVLSEVKTKSNYSANTLHLRAKREQNAIIRTYDINKNVVYTSDNKNIIRNYSDPYFCANYTGYHRDEVYRFGIVFYNEKNLASPVHWIGDIRMPSIQTVDSKSSLVQPFHSNTSGPKNEGANADMLGYALGVKFDVKNIPAEAKRYSIVRCSRNEQTRTIQYQAVVNGIIDCTKGDFWNGAFKVSGNYVWITEHAEIGLGESAMFAQPLLNTSEALSVYWNHGDVADLQIFYMSKEYLELISPEICVSQDDAQAVTIGSKICPIYNLFSYTGIENTAGYETFESVYERYKCFGLGVTPKKIYYLDGSIGDEGAHSFYWTYISYINKPSILLNDDYSPGMSCVFRYNNVANTNDTKMYQIDKCVAPDIHVAVQSFADAVKTNKNAIDSKVYHNISLGSFEQAGYHGKNLIVKIQDSFSLLPWKPSQTTVTPGETMSTAIVANIKTMSSFLTDSHSKRSTSTYVNCANHFNGESCICYGGDTFLTMFDYLNTSMLQVSNDTNVGSVGRMHTQCYIPFETTVNTTLFNNEQYHQTVEDDYEGITSGNNLMQHVIFAFPGYVQDVPQYDYNAIYSQQKNAISNISKSVYSEDDIKFTNRILASEPKINMEINNSWLIFKVANYIDVQNKYGQITNLKNHNNLLYFFQDNSLGIASVNDRALVATNTNELVLGTGGVLDRFDYVSTTNGTNIVNDHSIVTSDMSLYWYDPLKNSLCVQQNGVQELSKIKKVQSHFNSIYDKDRTNSVSIFDKKYNELWFKVADKTLIYNELFGVFTSFSSHDYNHCATLSDRFITVDGQNSFYNHNDFVKKNKAKNEMISTFKIVVNDKFVYPKVFDNVMFYADFNGNVNNITNLTFNTKNQQSKEISAANIECREDMYRLPIPRENAELSSTSYLGRMRGNYLIESYTLNCNDNKTFSIPYIKTTYRQSRL